MTPHATTTDHVSYLFHGEAPTETKWTGLGMAHLLMTADDIGLLWDETCCQEVPYYWTALKKVQRKRFRWASNPHYGSMSWVLYTCQDYCYVANWSLGHLTSSSLLKRSSHDVESHILLTTNWETLLPHVGSRNSSPAFHSCIHESRFAGVCNRPMYNTSGCSQQRQ